MQTLIQPITNKIVAKVYSKGKLNIPAPIKKDLQLDDGTEVLFIKHGHTWALTTREKMFSDAQAYFKSFNPAQKPIVDEFIAERHQQADEEAQ